MKKAKGRRKGEGESNQIFHSSFFIFHSERSEESRATERCGLRSFVSLWMTEGSEG